MVACCWELGILLERQAYRLECVVRVAWPWACGVCNVSLGSFGVTRRWDFVAGSSVRVAWELDVSSGLTVVQASDGC